MNCTKARKWISLDLDGELAPGRRDALQAHLDACPVCREVREQWARIGADLRARPVPQAQAPEAAWADVRRAIRLAGAREERPEPAWVFGVPVRVAAVIVLVLALGIGTWLMVGRPGAVSAARARTEVEWVETSLPGATPMVYEDAETGWTVIWVVEENGKEPRRAGT